jgi:hypothetical protein
MKIISGCQTGADFGGLAAAHKFGLETGGWMPPGFVTELGPKPHWAECFGLKEIKDKGSTFANYVARTYDNVQDSDGTIRFATDFNSSGEKCTLKAIKKFKKPYLDINPESPPSIEDMVDWIVKNEIQVLNIAGNRESKSRGIGNFVIDFLSLVFQKMGFVLKEQCNGK